MCFHGGYTHADRHLIDYLITEEMRAYDFASSYPFTMLTEKVAVEKYHERSDCSVDYILEHAEEYSYIFKLKLVRPQLKDKSWVFPPLQMSKCLTTINAIVDNGRILQADYCEIYLMEHDLFPIAKYMEWEKAICCEVEVAAKGYMPRWFTDYIYQCFVNKTMLKGGDPVEYAVSKSIVNSLYGMTVQRNISMDIVEDYESGDFNAMDVDWEESYNNYIKKPTSILPYQWGVSVTSAAYRHIFELYECCEHPVYTDTDSCYGYGWDEKKIESYNQKCKDKLRANGYGPVIRDDREYWLGVAETSDEDVYTEFKVMGAKRYAGRSKADGELHITIAGVPKRGSICLNDDLNNFTQGFVFPGSKTGKLLHTYFYSEIYVDENGNETGNSINLSPCDYLLDAVEYRDFEDFLYEEVESYAQDE